MLPRYGLYQFHFAPTNMAQTNSVTHDSPGAPWLLTARSPIATHAFALPVPPCCLSGPQHVPARHVVVPACWNLFLHLG